MLHSPPRIVALLLALFFLLAGGFAGYQLWRFYYPPPLPLPQYGQVPEFSLTTHHNATMTRSDLTGKVTIADFIFTNCAGPCPLMSAQMQMLQESLANVSAIQFLSVSVDPETDTPEVLAEYGQRFGARERWYFLTGEKDFIYRFIQSGFHLGVEDDPNAILHSTKFVLLDQNAVIRGYYDSEDQLSMDRLIDDSKRLATPDAL